MKFTKNILSKTFFILSITLVLVILGIGVFIFGYVFVGEPYLASKAEKIIQQQVVEAGSKVGIIDSQIWESRRVWRLLIDGTYIYLQVNPNFINNKVKLNIVNVIDKEASKECLESSWVKGRFWTIGIYYNEFAQETGLKFYHVSKVVNNLSEIENTIKSLPEVDNYPGKETIYINYNCKYRII